MRRGFTLLELMLVLCLAGLFLGLALPRVAALRDGSSVRRAASELGAAFSLARQEAIARRSMVTVVIDAHRGAVEVRSRHVALGRRPLASAYGVVLTANRDSIVYDPRGLGYGLSNLTVTVRRGTAVDTLSTSRLGRARW